MTDPKELSEAIEQIEKYGLPHKSYGKLKARDTALSILTALQNGELVCGKIWDEDRNKLKREIADLKKQLSEKSEEAEKYKDEIEKQAVIIEELGFLWWITMLLLYMYIWYRWLYIANRVKDKFAKFAAIWFSSRILMQAFINIWVNLNIIPLTWITLPFVSYWGSSLLSLMIWLGILLSISREVDEYDNSSRRDRFKVMF